MNKLVEHLETILLFTLFGFLTYAGFVAFKSIDFQVLSKLEKTPLVLPTPILTRDASPSAQPSHP